MSYTVTLLDTTGKKKSSLSLDSLSDAVVNEGLIHEYVVMYLANQRQGGAHTKTRGEVQRSGRKLYRQKGTGRARVGDAGSPIRRSGGVAMGPRSDRNWSKDMPKKMKKKAFLGALTLQAKAENIYAVQGLSYDTPSTKSAVAFVSSFHASGKSLLVVTGASDDGVHQSFRNINRTTVLPFSALNAYEVSKYHSILFTNSALDSLSSL